MTILRSKVYRYLSALLFLGLIPPDAMATHLRSVEIQVRQSQCSTLSVEIIVTAYVNYFGTNTQFGGEDSILDLGDGNSLQVPEIAYEVVDQALYIGRAQYKVVHTYEAYGVYKITYSEPNRNVGILNFTDSGATRFFTETSILFEEGKCNSSPLLLVPALDKACMGVAFSHNTAAIDVDGDSLSYELIAPKSASNTEVRDYLSPNQEPFYSSAGINYTEANEEKNGTPTFRVDEASGTLIWDAPGSPGEYGLAIKIKQWRLDHQTQTMYETGYVVRDMQIIVEDCGNNKPLLEAPHAVCVIAGDTLRIEMPASDRDGHDVVIEAFSEVFISGVADIATEPASGTLQSTAPPHIASFKITWKTTCEEVRKEPYRIVMKISDRPPSGPRLSQFYTLDVKIIAPPPVYENVTVNPVTKAVTLRWADYRCDNVDSFQIWRRISAVEYDQPECQTGLPASLRYELITEVPATLNEYTDSNLSHGSQYCYRIVPLIGTNRVDGRSSIDTCFIPKPAEAPVIVNVSVQTTDALSGTILLRWTHPFDIDKNQYPPPYLYRILRKNDSYPNSTFTPVMSAASPDTVFNDTHINTQENIYRYKIELYVPALTTAAVDTSSEASSPFATSESMLDGIKILWRANTPWSNYSQQHPWHLIYRSASKDGPFVLIDSVNVNLSGFMYTDLGNYQNLKLSKTPYFYKVKTRGTYGNPEITDPLENLSQVATGQILDTIPPCVARPSIEQTDCSSFACDGSDYFVTVAWETDCAGDVVSHEIFVKDDQTDSFALLTRTTENHFVHRNITSLNKCYRVVAIDQAGNRSDSSMVVCSSNCTNFKLPNVITPGIKDDRNDNLTTYPESEENREDCARSVERVDLRILSRWGDEIFVTTVESNADFYWDGRNVSGQEVASGIYFYHASVRFDTNDPARKNQQMKGWVRVIR